MAGVTLDTGALIALDRNDRRVITLIARAVDTGSRITIPASAFAQAVRQLVRQAYLSRLVRQPIIDVVALDRIDAIHVGRLLAETGTADVVDALELVCARRAGQAIVTSDPNDLVRLDSTIKIVVV